MAWNLRFIVAAATGLYFSVSLALKVEFVQRPQNHTIFSLQETFVLNCSTNVASDEGMDWLVRLNGRFERICESKNIAKQRCRFNYLVESPDNRTFNLIVDPELVTLENLGDMYCCQAENGYGNRTCSYLTFSLMSDSAATSEFPRVTTIAHDSVTVSDKSSTDVGVIVGVVVAVVGIVVAFGVVVTVIQIRRCNRRGRGGNNGGNYRPPSEQ